MADAQSFARQSFAPLLLAAFLFAALFAAAAGPAFAQEHAPRLKLHSSDLGTVDQPIRTRRAPVIGKFFNDDRSAVPTWTLPLGALEALGIGAKDRDRRGLTFGIKRSRGLKGTAKLRF